MTIAMDAIARLSEIAAKIPQQIATDKQPLPEEVEALAEIEALRTLLHEATTKNASDGDDHTN